MKGSIERFEKVLNIVEDVLYEVKEVNKFMVMCYEIEIRVVCGLICVECEFGRSEVSKYRVLRDL